MTIANDIIFLSLRNSGVNGIGQTPMANDVNDAFKVLNAWIAELALERRVQVNRIVLPLFPDLTTDVPFWSDYEHVLLTSMSVRLRQIYALPPVDIDVQLAVSALAAFNAINLQQISADPAVNVFTLLSVIMLALRAAGRLSDKQGIDPASQDVTDAQLHLAEMVDEWERERQVRVNPNPLPNVLGDLNAPIDYDTWQHGMGNAIVLNLAVRLRDAWGEQIPPSLQARADRALQLVQAINLQQLPPPVVDPFTPRALVMMALRAAGRITDMQGADPNSQDVFEAYEHMAQMIDEWDREREVRVIPGNLPDVRSGLDVPINYDTIGHGMGNAIVLNLAVRLRDAWGQEIPKSLQERADRALQLVQAINQQQIAPLTPGGMPSTVRTAIILALRLAGRVNDNQRVSDTSADVADALSLLTMMLAQWQRKRWLIWNETETAKMATGNQWYSIGPGGDFAIPRPDRIHGAFCRLGPFNSRNPVDIPLSIIEAKEDWARITIKDLGSIPGAVFYDSAFPAARLTFWPVPASGLYEMHILTKAPLPGFLTISDALALPPEYIDAVVNNLACRMIVASGGQISPFLLGQARASLETIKLTNVQIPLLTLPNILSGRGGDVSSWAGRGLNRAWTLGGEAVL